MPKTQIPPRDIALAEEQRQRDRERLRRRMLHEAARMIAVQEMMLDPNRLEFARWLIATGRITDYA